MADRSGLERAWRAWRRAAPLAAAALVWSGAAGAQEPTRAPVDPGREAFVQYCAACHGADAQGGGPLASELRTAPPDLTRLAERYGSPLQTQRLLERIDGRDMARAHGSREMPVWGRKLARNVPRTQSTEAHTRGTLLIIIDWLQSIQQQP